MEQDIEKTIERIVACTGGGEGLGHPKVYLEINEEGYVSCPYCSKRFEIIS